MFRVLSVLMAAAALLIGVQAASAQYYGPVDYYDAPPRGYDYEDRYDRYGPPPYYDELDDRVGPERYEESPPFLSERYYRDRPPYGAGYGYGAPRYYEDDPRYGDEYYLDEDLPPRPAYRDERARETLSSGDESGTPPQRRGFDPRRPHLGDGTDAPSAQFYARRPRSCGEFYYWDGRACVDARKYPPYVGPRP